MKWSHAFKGNFDSWSTILDKEQKLGIFMECFELIPQEKRLNLFRRAYKVAEYGFRNITLHMLKEIYKDHRTDFKGQITIYRGFAVNKSTPFSKCYSWTIKKEVAERFADRFGDDGIVAMAKVNGEDILDYLPERGEYEVLILPESVKEYEYIKFNSNAK